MTETSNLKPQIHGKLVFFSSVIYKATSSASNTQSVKCMVKLSRSDLISSAACRE